MTTTTTSCPFSLRSPVGVALAVGAASALFYLLKHNKPCCGHAEVHRDAHVFLVDLTIKDGFVDEFIQRWSVLAQHCRENEPNTLTYELSRSTENSSNVIIYERYVTKEDLTVTHNSSNAFKQFGAWIQSTGCVVSKRASSYTESNIGYLAK